jgi:hypothetical protein
VGGSCCSPSSYYADCQRSRPSDAGAQTMGFPVAETPVPPVQNDPGCTVPTLGGSTGAGAGAGSAGAGAGGATASGALSMMLSAGAGWGYSLPIVSELSGWSGGSLRSSSGFGSAVVGSGAVVVVGAGSVVVEVGAALVVVTEVVVCSVASLASSSPKMPPMMESPNSPEMAMIEPLASFDRRCHQF